MDHQEFLDIHTAMIEKIKASGVKMKWYGALAYEMAEKEHILLYGEKKYASYQSFMSCRSNNKKGRYQEPGDTDNDKPDFVPVFKKKRQPVFRRTEFDSKFNWLF